MFFSQFLLEPNSFANTPWPFQNGQEQAKAEKEIAASRERLAKEMKEMAEKKKEKEARLNENQATRMALISLLMF